MWRIICVLYGCNLGERAEWRANSGIFTVDDVDDDDDGRWLMYATAAVSDNNYLFMVRSYVLCAVIVMPHIRDMSVSFDFSFRKMSSTLQSTCTRIISDPFAEF